MVWTVCEGTVRQIKQMLDWRRHLSVRSLQFTKRSTAASARPAEGLGRGGRDHWHCLGHVVGEQRGLLPPLCTVTTDQQERSLFSGRRRLSSDSSSLPDGFLLKTTICSTRGRRTSNTASAGNTPPNLPTSSLPDPGEHSLC